MRAERIVAIALASLACVLCAASCVQGPEATSGVGSAPDEEPAFIETKEEGDIGGDPDLGIGSGLWEAAADPQLLAICLALAPASVPAKEAFCRSLPDGDARRRCWKYRWNRAEWIGWCYAEFS